MRRKRSVRPLPDVMRSMGDQQENECERSEHSFSPDKSAAEEKARSASEAKRPSSAECHAKHERSAGK